MAKKTHKEKCRNSGGNPIYPDDFTNEDKQKFLPLRSKLQEVYYLKNNQGKYRESFCEFAIEVLSRDHFQSLTHLAVALGITKNTLSDWRTKYPDFNDAVVYGLSNSEVKTRDKVKGSAFEPSRDVNNGLIKILLNNVYGIKDDTNIVVNNTNTIGNPEEEMKKRGIPIPDDLGEDISDE